MNRKAIPSSSGHAGCFVDKQDSAKLSRHNSPNWSCINRDVKVDTWSVGGIFWDHLRLKLIAK